MNKHSWRYVLLTGIFLLGFYLRVRDPISTTVIGAEDPYMHMARTWEFLATGDPFTTRYPPGFYLLLAPLALMGPEVFAQVARLGPPVLGGLAIPAVYMLCREHLGEAGSMTGAFLVAIMPEHIRRTDLLFPTLLDLVLLPFLLIHLLRAADGDRRSIKIAAGIGVFLLLVHPWVLGLFLPVALVFLGIRAWTSDEVPTTPVAWTAVGVAVLGLMVVFFPGTFNPARGLVSTALPRFGELLQDPSSLTPLPRFVDPGWMLTVPALVLAGMGVLSGIIVPRHRTPFTLLGVLWVALLLPMVLVDWFGVWFLPHRTAVFLSVGVAMLAGVAVDALAGPLQTHGPRWAQVALLAVVVVSSSAVALPHALGEGDWDRYWEEEDQEAWWALSDREPEHVEIATWRTRAGYEGLTGSQAERTPDLWWDEQTRQDHLDRHPGMYVIVDDLTHEEEVPTGFLDGDGWRKVDTRGNTTVYQHQG